MNVNDSGSGVYGAFPAYPPPAPPVSSENAEQIPSMQSSDSVSEVHSAVEDAKDKSEKTSSKVVEFANKFLAKGQSSIAAAKEEFKAFKEAASSTFHATLDEASEKVMDEIVRFGASLPSTNELKNKINSSISTIWNKEQSNFQKIAQNIAERSEGGVVDPQLRKEIAAAIKVASKNMKSGELKQLEIQGLADHKILVVKDEKKISVFLKERSLGKGISGEVFLASPVMSSHSATPMAFKFGFETNSSDIQNEKAILQHLNHSGPMEGIQGALTISHAKINGDISTIVQGKHYSNGDMNSIMLVRQIVDLFGLPSDQLRLPDESNADQKQRIQGHIDQFIDRMTDKIFERQTAINQLPENSPERSAEQRKLNEEIGHDINPINNGLRYIINDKKDSAVFSEQIGDLISALQKGTLADANQSEGTQKNSIRELYSSIISERASVIVSSLPTVSTESKLKFTANLLQGLIHLQNAGVVHGDLKPANFFWNNNEAVIADFGGAHNLSDAEGPKEELAMTKNYHQPEDYSLYEKARRSGDRGQMSEIGKRIDQYSMAVSIYNLFTGNPAPVTSNLDSEEFNRMPETFKTSFLEAGISNDEAERATELLMRMKSDNFLGMAELFELTNIFRR